MGTFFYVKKKYLGEELDSILKGTVQGGRSLGEDGALSNTQD